MQCILFDLTSFPLGDTIAFTGAIRNVKHYFGNKIDIHVSTAFPRIFTDNTDINASECPSKVHVIVPRYPDISTANQANIHLIEAYVNYVGEVLECHIPICTTRPKITVYDHNMSRSILRDHYSYNGKYWIVCCGGKYDYTIKWTDPTLFESIGQYLLDENRIGVQVGVKSPHYFHPPIPNVLDMVGKTTLDQLITLAYHSQGIICSSTSLVHLAAALNKPCIVLAGGREPLPWQYYGGHAVLSTVGQLPCCRTGGCWKHRCFIPTKDLYPKLDQLCPYQTTIDNKVQQWQMPGDTFPIAKCMKYNPSQITQLIEQIELQPNES